MLAFVGKCRRKNAVFVMFIHNSFQQELLELKLIESSLYIVDKEALYIQ